MRCDRWHTDRLIFFLTGIPSATIAIYRDTMMRQMQPSDHASKASERITRTLALLTWSTPSQPAPVIRAPHA